MNPAIVILAFNRPQSLSRLLRSIEKAEYPENVKLIISLEFNSTPEVLRIAENFSCSSLNVTVVMHSDHLGLRKHVMECGDYADKYGSVIILEDDILVDRFFYIYASNALKFYEDSKNIAGISLYGYEYNEFANVPFAPMANGFDTYAMQIPCSWGQCWTKKQWLEFKKWYKGKEQEDLVLLKNLPAAVKGWPESSWKKYFHGFMVEKNLYFIYPYQSYSTNCSDSNGTHQQKGTNLYQTSFAIQSRLKPSFNFCPNNNCDVLYDSFMEPAGSVIELMLALSLQEVEIDLQGTKPINVLRSKPFALTLKKGGNAIKNYKANLRPVECNLSEPITNSGGGVWQLVKSQEIPMNSRNTISIELLNYQSKTNFSNYLKLRNLFIGILKILLFTASLKLKMITKNRN